MQAAYGVMACTRLNNFTSRKAYSKATRTNEVGEGDWDIYIYIAYIGKG